MTSMNVIDGTSIWNTMEHYRQVLARKLAFDYHVLSELLIALREEEGYSESQTQEIFISVDTHYETNSNSIVEVIEEAGIMANPIDYRQIGQFTNIQQKWAQMVAPHVNLSPNFTPQISYLLGQISKDSDRKHIIVVSNQYEVLWPLNQLAKSFPNSRFGLVYFDEIADSRIKAESYADNTDLQVDLFPLDMSHVEELFHIGQDHQSPING